MAKSILDEQWHVDSTPIIDGFIVCGERIASGDSRVVAGARAEALTEATAQLIALAPRMARTILDSEFASVDVNLAVDPDPACCQECGLIAGTNPGPHGTAHRDGCEYGKICDALRAIAEASS